jgi:hypothetical protein
VPEGFEDKFRVVVNVQAGPFEVQQEEIWHTVK